MAIGTNSYGTIAGVASLTPRYLDKDSNTFDGDTRPTLIQVESFIDQVSGMLNSYLSQEGFSIPVSQEDVKLALDLFVNQEVASIVEGVNGHGRFGPSQRSPGGIRFSAVMKDAKEFIESQAEGFEILGASRSKSLFDGIGTRDQDESGNDTFPIFQRKGFGNSFTDWDND